MDLKHLTEQVADLCVDIAAFIRTEAPKLTAMNIQVNLMSQREGEPYLEICDGPVCEYVKSSKTAEEILRIFDSL